MINYFITGLSGFVGKNILIELNKRDDVRIIAFILPQEENIKWLHQDNIILVKGNLLNYDDVFSFLNYQVEGDKYIIHIAGRITTLKKGDPLTFKINYEGTKNVVDATNKVGDFKKLVYVSSVDSLPKQNGNDDIYEATEYSEEKVDGVYSKSKVAANNYILDNCKINSSIVLPSAIVGPNDPNNAPINNAINKFINGKLPAITSGGYNLVDVRDVALGTLSAVTLGKDKESYILSGEYISVKDLIGLAASITNMKPVTFKIPHFLIKAISPFIELHAKIHHKVPLFTGFSMDCLNQNSNYNHKKATSELNYSSRPLTISIQDTINYLRNSQ